MADLLTSSLSIATNAISTFIEDNFRTNGVSIRISRDAPAIARKSADEAQSTDAINLFFYRVVPSGFQVSVQPNEPFMMRLHCLVTPFASTTRNGGNPTETDFRLLGEVVRLLHENPSLGVFPKDASNPHSRYQLDAIMLAPDMEELNHIWTTQGSDTPYKLSVPYEFSLFAVDPVQPFVPPAKVTLATLDVAGDPFPPRPVTSNASPTLDGDTVWTPTIGFDDNGNLTDSNTIPRTNANFTLQVVGAFNEPIILEIAGRDDQGFQLWGHEVSADVTTTNPQDASAAKMIAVQSANLEASLFAATATLSIRARTASPFGAPLTPPVTLTLETVQ